MLILMAPLFLLGCQEKSEQRKSVPYVSEEKSAKADRKILSDSEVKDLSNRLHIINKNLKFQVLVRVIPKVPSEGIERYAAETFNNIGIGNKFEDRGALFVLAHVDRQYRLETGRGTEGFIPDHKAKEIVVAAYPYFKLGQWYNGINASLNEFEKQIKEGK